MVTNFRFRSIEQKILFNQPKDYSRDLILGMVINFRFKSVEQQILFIQLRNWSRDLIILYGDKCTFTGKEN